MKKYSSKLLMLGSLAFMSVNVVSAESLAVTLYEDVGQTGTTHSFETGEYPRFGSGFTDIRNNRASSVHVPMGCTTEIFRDPDFDQTDGVDSKITLSAGDYDFPHGNPSDNNNFLADDVASSIKVTCEETGGNTAPVAQDDNATTDGSEVTIDVLGNDTDADSDPLSLITTTQPTNGTVAIANGQLVYTPNQGFVGTDSFTYTISDGNGQTATATVQVDVAAMPEPDLGITLFQHIEFDGVSNLFSTDIPDLGDSDSNNVGQDQTSSMIVPEGCAVRLYLDRDFSGDSQGFGPGEYNDLRNYIINHDNASSVRVFCNPPASGLGVTLYEHIEFDGITEKFVTDDANLQDNAVNEDHVSSMIVPEGCAVRLYLDRDFSGDSQGFGPGEYNDLRNYIINHDNASSVRVFCNPPASGLGVTLYEHIEFDGITEKFVTDDANLQDNAVNEDHVSSMIVPEGCTVRLYEDVNYQGNSQVFGPGEIADLREVQIGHDNASSIRVSCSPVAPPTPLKVVLYHDQDQSGISEEYPTGEYVDFSDDTLTDIGNNTVSSVRVPEGCTVEIFRDKRFGNTDNNHSVITLTAGDYNFPLTNDSGEMADNAASSMKVDCESSSS